MTNKNSAENGPIRLKFELNRADDPLLYDDLMRCHQGARRVNRLRLLAHEGAVMQVSLLNGGTPFHVIPVQPALREPQPTTTEIDMPLATDVFGDPVQEG
jgi:hypothetical protein